MNDLFKILNRKSGKFLPEEFNNAEHAISYAKWLEVDCAVFKNDSHFCFIDAPGMFQQPTEYEIAKVREGLREAEK